MKLIIKELELYEPSLLEKPSILVINKMDTENAEEEFQEFLTLYNDYESRDINFYRY